MDRERPDRGAVRRHRVQHADWFRREVRLSQSPHIGLCDCPYSSCEGTVITLTVYSHTSRDTDTVGFYNLTRCDTSFGSHLVEVLASRDAPKPVLNVSVQDLGVILETQELNDINLIDVREQNEWDGSCISKFTLKPLSGIREWSATASEGNYSHLPHSASLITAPT